MKNYEKVWLVVTILLIVFAIGFNYWNWKKCDEHGGKLMREMFHYGMVCMKGGQEV